MTGHSIRVTIGILPTLNSPAHERQDLFMIKRQPRQLLQRVPASRRGVVGSTRSYTRSIDSREIDDADRPPARVPLRVAESMHLHQMRGTHSGFFIKLASRCRLQSLIHIDEASRNGPHAGKGLVLSPDEQNARRLVSTDYHHVHGHRRPWVSVGEFLPRFSHELATFNKKPDTTR